MSVEAMSVAVARSRSSGLHASSQSRLPSEPRDLRNMQHLSSHVSTGTATALALTQIPKCAPSQEAAALWTGEDLRVSQSHLRSRQQRPLMADGVPAPRFPMPAGWGNRATDQAEPCEIVVSGELSGVASRALAQHPYPQIPARLLQAAPPLPPKTDSPPPPGIILKAVRNPAKRRVNSSSARALETQKRPSRQNSSGLSAQDDPVLPRRANTTAGTRTSSGVGASSPREKPCRRASSSASRRNTMGILPDSPTANAHNTIDRSNSGCSSPSSRRRPHALGDNSSSQATLGQSGEFSGSLKSAAAMASGWGPSLASTPGTKRKVAKREICLLRSVFEGRPPVVYFQYEPRCGAPQRDTSRALGEEELNRDGFEGGLPKMFFCHEKTKDVHEYNAMLNTSRHGGLHRTGINSSKWSLFWGAHPSPDLLRSFHRFQKANHFPASWHLGRKDLLWKNVYRMKRQFPQHFNIMPVGFVMPDDFQAWMTAREQSPGALWIYKPANLSCGRGIKLISSSNSPASDKKLAQKTGIIQRYVDKPMQINGYKFDLRVYVLVTSFDPLKVYLNSEGLVRLATERYEQPTPENLDHRTMHLTNYSVNKHADCYVKNLDGGNGAKVGSPTPHDGAESGEEEISHSFSAKATSAAQEEPDDEDKECCGAEDGDDDDISSKLPDGTASTGTNDMSSFKWSFSQLRDYCSETGQDYELLMDRVKDLIIKTLLSVEAPIVNTWHQGANYSTCGMSSSQVGPNQTCFEIYGFDVMLDENLKPWLLEVNTFPSLSSSSPFDKRVKTMLIADSLTLAGFLPFDHELVDRAVKEDHLKRLQGLHQKHTSAVVRSHTINNISTASLKSLGEAEWQLILDTHDEFMRRGQFERIYPTREAVDRYAGFFSAPRYSNAVLARWLHEGGERCFTPEGRGEIPPWVPRLTSSTAC